MLFQSDWYIVSGVPLYHPRGWWAAFCPGDHHFSRIALPVRLTHNQSFYSLQPSWAVHSRSALVPTALLVRLVHNQPCPSPLSSWSARRIAISE